MSRAITGTENILAYITLKSGRFRYKPKYVKNTGIRLVVQKAVGSNPISHSHEIGTFEKSEVLFPLFSNMKFSDTKVFIVACTHIDLLY